MHFMSSRFPILINRASPFEFKGCCVFFFVFDQISTSANSEILDQTQCHEASGLVLHRMSMSHKRTLVLSANMEGWGGGILFLLILRQLFTLIKNFAFPF